MNDILNRIVDRLVEKGVPREIAIQLVQRAATRIEAAGLGEDSAIPAFIPGAAVIEQARQTVSPWLWMMSVAGFIMATVNTRRIAKMFGSWKQARAQTMRLRRRAA